MRYYSNPAAAFSAVAAGLPSGVLADERLTDALSYFSRLPQEFVASEFGFEIYLQSERVDIGFSHPLALKRTTLLPAVLKQLEGSLASASPGWVELQGIAERTAALPGAEDLKGLSVGVDAPTVSSLGCPKLVYLSFIRSAPVSEGQSFTPRGLKGFIDALLPEAPKTETRILSTLERLKYPSHQLAQVGVSLGGQPGKLRFYVAGTISDQLKLLDALQAGHRKAAKLLAALVDQWADWRSSLFLRETEGCVGRLDIEIYPAKECASSELSPVQSVCNTALFRDLVPKAKRQALSSMAEGGTYRAFEKGVAPVSIRLNHIKFSEKEEGGDCQWKAYVACRQGGAVSPTHTQSQS